MLRNKIYYQLKPFLPYPLRATVRRRLAVRQKARARATWPIMPGSERPPEGWPGWPEGKKFAIVLTHDVESQRGLDRVRQLAEMEMELGFRSSFNFTPEGGYSVPSALRDWLTDRGFEVGVHDLHHDGKLYSSREGFNRKAERINHYVRDWNAVGFRSGFMLHNLDWLSALDVRYDASCFDTDPFEPQPDGVHTIFPFWVPRVSDDRRQQADDRRQRTEDGSSHIRASTFELRNSAGAAGGYVELPYTLPQDSTVFLLLGEETTAIWRQKLDWVAAKGGMALLNVHPDYLSFVGAPRKRREFRASHYSEFLQYIEQQYGELPWRALPREVASHITDTQEKIPTTISRQTTTSIGSTPLVKIWIDIDNTPHVPFFIPIIRELEKRGHRVVVTARDAFQVCAFADRKGLHYVKVGKHYGKNPLLKIFGLVWRSIQLIRFCRREQPDIAVSHGSRSQALLFNVLRKPTVFLQDWEFSNAPPLTKPRWEIVPELYPSDNFLSKPQRVRRYPGIKEDVYAPEFKPDSAIVDELELNGDRIIVTVRPPADEAHYHNPESESFLNDLMGRICQTPNVLAVLLPRNQQQAKKLKSEHPEWFRDAKTIIPSRVVDGLNLLWHSDLVVSGGGTMNREAAALGVPVYSIFRGKTGAIDQQLEREGRLVMIRSSDEVRTKILLQRRDTRVVVDNRRKPALETIVDHIEEIVRADCSKRLSD